MYISLALLAIAQFKLTLVEGNRALGCKPFHEIYKDGTGLCETMWGDAFKVVPDEPDDIGYTMGFYDSVSPNTAYSKKHMVPWVTETVTGVAIDGEDVLTIDGTDKHKIWPGETYISIDDGKEYKVLDYNSVNNKVTVDQTLQAYTGSIKIHGFKYDSDDVSKQPMCNLQYFHTKVAKPQVTGVWKSCQSHHDSSCCEAETVSSWDKMNENYGEKYHVDRCGPMSDSCKNFFTMEHCLYECDPSAGLYRKYADPINEDLNENTWEMFEMPIRQGFCDDWYRACYNDYFCSQDSGDFFSCAAIYVPDKTEAEKWNDTLTAIVVCVVFGGSVLSIALGYMIYREKQGQAVFTPLIPAETQSSLGTGDISHQNAGNRKYDESNDGL